MPPTVAVAHYPEGAGHATRMVAIANAIESAGGTVRMAGGGAGTQFVDLNGYDEFEPTTVDYIDTYQGGSLWQTVSRSVPASLRRTADYKAWLSATDPDALVTDDMFAAMAADRCDVPLYVLKHDMPGLYDDAAERAGARFHTLFQLSAAREFFYPVVWPGSAADPDRATRIPPVALDGEATVRNAPDVVVVPSHYSSLSRIGTHLRRQGYDVLDVADDDWEAVPSLLPYIREADCVVCSGYSSIMDAAVAGTPCVVLPETDEQRAVADWLERFDVSGFAVATEPIDVFDAVADPPAAPSFANGATVIARRVMTDLRNPDPFASPAPSGRQTDGRDQPDSSRLGTLAALTTLAAACLTTTGSLAAPSRLRRRIGATARRVGATAGRIRVTGQAVAGRGWHGGRSVAATAGSGLKRGTTRLVTGSASALAAGAEQCHRAISRVVPTA